MRGELQRQLGVNLRRHRQMLGLSQERLGERWGYYYRYIGRLERGQCNVTLRTLEHLAGLVGEDDPLALLRGRCTPAA